MVGVTATGAVLATLRWSPFLLVVSAFGFYLVGSGYRSLSRTRPPSGFAWADWAIAGVVLLVTAGGTAPALLGRDGWLVTVGGMPRLLPITLGAGCLWFVLADAWNARAGSIRPDQRITGHLTRMVGSFVTTIATVSVTNLTFLPLAVRPLWPLAIGGPLLLYWLRRYRP